MSMRNVHSNIRRALSTNSRTPKSSDTTYVVLKTRFSEKLTQSKSLDTTSVVSKPKIDVGSALKAKNKVVQIVLWIVDSGCSKHMTGDRSLLKNFIEKFMGTVRFGNDNFAAITGYGNYIQGNITICHVYYVEEDSTHSDGNSQFVSYNPPSHEEIESSTTALEPSNVQNFHQVQPSTHIWTKDHPLDQVIGDPSKPFMTRQWLHTDSEICMYALTVSTIEPKNIKEAMADHSWIESMQDELN
ncbi:hypothetical protein Tco_0271860 [Tanacetum coccineum]